MKITITADAYALTSTIKISEIALLKKCNPDALKVKDENGNEKFAVDYLEGRPNVSTFGVTFGGKTRDEKEYATATFMLPENLTTADAAKSFVAEKVAPVIAYMTQLETSVHEAATKEAEARQAIIDSIVVA